MTLAELFEVEERGDNGDRERRKAVEQIVDMLSTQEVDAIQAAAKIFRTIVNTRWKPE